MEAPSDQTVGTYDLWPNKAKKTDYEMMMMMISAGPISHQLKSFH